MKVLVAGGAGYIGSHTVKRLMARGHEPVIFDNLSTGHLWAVRSPHFVKGDIGNPDAVGDALQRYEIEAVIHFAACAYVGESVGNPAKYYQNNVAGSLSLFDTMLKAGVRNVIFSSTCATYGLPVAIPIPEEHPQAPVNPYGDTKLVVERVLQSFGKAYRMRWVALRYFNAAGSDPAGDLGEDHDPETHLIPLAIQAALGHAPPLSIFGTDYPTPDGTAIRDYVHVTDLAEAHCQALEYLARGGEPAAINLGTGKGHSVREVIAAVEAVSGRRVPYVDASRREGDPPVLVAAASRAQKLLGWAPRYRDLPSIVGTAWPWHSSRRSPLVQCASR